jgi:hypothetical protein
MISMIAPLVQVASARRALGALVAHLVGLLMGGIVTYGIAALIGRAFITNSPEHKIVGAAIVGLSWLTLIGRLPQSGWQVPPGWMANHLVFGAWRYGLVLGTGLLTKAPYAAWLGSLVIVVGLGAPLLSLSMGVAYGFGRWLPVAIEYRRRRPAEDAIREWSGWWPTLHRIDLIFVAAAAAGFVLA